MPFSIIRSDITKVTADAIVNAANKTLLGGGGVDGAIHRAAGPMLLAECMTLGGCKTGEAKLTKGYKLPCRFVIHTVGPVWRGGGNNEEQLLRNCYKNSLQLAKKNGCESIAFPLISAGAYGYPKAEAVRIASEEITAFLADNDMDVTLVVFEREAVQLSEKLCADIEQYIDDNYVRAHDDSASRFMQSNVLSDELAEDTCEYKPKKLSAPRSFSGKACAARESMPPPSMQASYVCAAAPVSLDEALADMDSSFSEYLLELIDRSGKTDVEVYKRANIDRKLFSKIRSDRLYRPKKNTALAFAIALCLPLEETEKLLKRAGYTLSHSSKADVIIEFFIKRGEYDIYTINEALFAYDQTLIGG